MGPLYSYVPMSVMLNLEQRIRYPNRPVVRPEPPAPVTVQERERKTRLDQGVLAEIRSDITRTVVPSWLQLPPRDFGDAGHGTLKADYWRSAFSVSLLISLPRLWVSSEPDYLANFCDLVVAVKHIMRRSILEIDVTIYQLHMLRYLEGLTELYGRDCIKPNHHLAAHIPVFVKRYGPVQNWWMFPFERMNGFIQGLNHNAKHGKYGFHQLSLLLTSLAVGELEKTLYTRFYQGCLLSQLIKFGDFDQNVQNVLGAVLKSVSGRHTPQGTLDADMGTESGLRIHYLSPEVQRATAAVFSMSAYQELINQPGVKGTI
jgi:hypothetical protein